MFFEKISNFFSALFFSNFFSTFFTLFKTVKLIEKYSYNKFFIEFPFKNRRDDLKTRDSCAMIGKEQGEIPVKEILNIL